MAHLGMLVGGVVVDDGVDAFPCRDLRLDGVEEADEFLMPVALHVAADDGAVEHVERGEQRRRAVALVVVGHRSGAARLHRQSRLGAVERLDLALLVDREDDGMGGRIDVEADDVLEFLGELRVVRQLERPDAMRRELVRLQDALHRAQADPGRLGQHPAGPVGCFSRRRPERQIDHPLHGAGGSGGLPGLRVLSRGSPSTPSAMKRACHVHTTGFDLPERRMISAVPQPSAVARIMFARHTCFCGALRSETIASSRWRSSGVTLTTIPALITRA